MRRRIAAAFFVLSALGMPHSAKCGKKFKYSVIVIQYERETDKAVFPIVISDSKAGAEWCQAAILNTGKTHMADVHVVLAPLLSKLIADAQSFRGTAQQETEGKSKSFIAVAITLVTPLGKHVIMMDAKSGSSLLEILKKDCKDDESLLSDLSDFQSRILELVGWWHMLPRDGSALDASGGWASL
jgi:hypothetical protein